MTQDRYLKRAIRERMALTGEKYTTARRELLGAPERAVRRDPIGAALRPGTVTAFVSGGGATNFEMALPSLVALLDRGHTLFVVALGRPHVDQLPSPLDFVVAQGLAKPDEVAERLVRRDRSLVEAVEKVLARVRLVASRTPIEQWRDLLGAGSVPAVLWVQDIQVDGPLAVVSDRSGFHEIPAQLAGLRSLARDTGSIVGVGHCAGGSDGEKLVTDAVDEAFVVEHLDLGLDRSARREVHLHHFVLGRETAVEHRWLESPDDDHRRDWRLLWHARRERTSPSVDSRGHQPAL